jgi:GGDEF domain-containing protein
MNSAHSSADASASGAEFLLAASEFQRALEQERALSDRSGEPFALLVFELRGLAPARAQACLGVIARRVRATDILGHLGEQQVGVLLRYARVEDALRVAHEVRALARAERDELVCSVHGHPPFPGTARATPATAVQSHHVELQPDLL